MPSRCAVVTCHSWAKKGRREEGLAFFRFPKDKALRTEWLHKCARGDKLNLDNTAVCSKHFLAADYDPSYLVKRTLLPDMKPKLISGAVPSQNLPTSISSTKAEHRAERQKQQQQQQKKKPADGVDSDQDEREKRKQLNIERRRERQEKRDRKELVEKLLAEHEAREQAELDARRQAEAKKARKRSGRPLDSVAQAMTRAGLVPEPGGPDDDTAAGERPAADLSDDDGPPPDDDGASAGSNSDGEDGRRSPVGSGKANPSAASSGKPVRIILRKKSSAARLMPRRHYLMLDRTKEIMRLKLKVRRLEAKCLRVLGGPTVRRPIDDISVCDEPAEGKTGSPEERTTESGEGQENQADPQAGEAPGSALRSTGEEPLVILRNDRGSGVPSILRQIQAHQLSDSMATSMPSNFAEAMKANHQLKLQFLNLQAVLLRWAIQNKKLRNDDGKVEEEGTEESAASVRGPRLRELLRLEAAVKAMFTEAQLRAIVRNHADSAGDDPAEKRRKQPWGEEDLRRMLELRAISSDRVVEHVREKMRIPLPSMKTAKRRCRMSTRTSEAYKEMLQKSEENQKLCDMCKGQVNTIDGVIDAAEDKPPEASEESPFGRQFVQHLPRQGQRTGDAGPKKRPRTAKAGTVTSKRKKHEEAAALDWRNTSDSDAELSDPGLWDRIPSSRVSWQPDMIGGSAPRSRSQQQRPSAPDGYRRPRPAWY